MDAGNWIACYSMNIYIYIYMPSHNCAGEMHVNISTTISINLDLVDIHMFVE